MHGLKQQIRAMQSFCGIGHAETRARACAEDRSGKARAGQGASEAHAECLLGVLDGVPRRGEIEEDWDENGMRIGCESVCGVPDLHPRCPGW